MRQDVSEIKKVMDKHQYDLDSIIVNVLEIFKFKFLCCKIGLVKQAGFCVPMILGIMLMLPFTTANSIGGLYTSRFRTITEMNKDVFYRLLNMQRMPWRRLLYEVVKQFQKLTNSNNEAADNSAFILDDTVDQRVGRKLENVSMVHDHTVNKMVIGFKCLVLGLFDGTSFMPVDFSIHSEKALKKKDRKRQFKKKVAKNSNGYKRRRECRVSKLQNGLAMLKRAIKKGLKAKYVLVDSWLGSLHFIQTVREIKDGAMHVIFGVRNDKRKYTYDGQDLNSKELRKLLKKKGAEKRSRKWNNTRYYEVVVYYEGVGTVKLYLCRLPYQKKWRVFLFTDCSLTFAKMMEIYSVRWTIEVFFREAKQHLRLGKCQSRDFDAQIASMTIVCILYTLLSYYRRIHDYQTLGGLFKDLSDEICERNMAERLFDLFEELLMTVIKLISESGVVDITLFIM